MVALGISEILKKVEAEKDVDKKVEILRQNNSPVLQGILRMPFHKDLRWLLPEGKPPFKPTDEIGTQGRLFSEWRRLYLFFPGTPLNQTKREMIFIQILETLDPNDADLLCAVKDKKMPYKSVTKSLIEKAFPGIFDFLKNSEAKVDG
jgi:hypothetical protein